ncbi:MAG: helicase-exonuclease AddAB subunit AddA [Lachnospiraceae bacterium]|nr:helicase-exonuclease AddAB subunit AddA [Lachnospiraceae bacterium]
MSMKWTKEQQQVIDLRDRNILVAAAAGSGKTAVLVERIIGRILDKNHPVDIDRMLIVTFTNAAAAEMRERISAAIENALMNDPENTHLQKQATLIHNAQITTIHSFCLYLIRNYFHRIDLEPNFRIAEEGELNLLREDVLETVLNQNYEEKTESFIQFVESFATGKNDDVLRELILKLYHFATSYPWPKEWLSSITKNYDFTNFAELEEKKWMQELMKYIYRMLDDILKKAEENVALTMEYDGPDYAAEVADRDKIRLEHLLKTDDYQSLSQAIKELSFDRMPVKRKYEGSIEKLELFKANREEIKDTIKKLKEQYFFAPEEELLSRLQKMAPVVSELVRLTEEFMTAYDAKKREKNILDFDDLEHFALRILLDENTKEPTEVARECRRIFDEVMVDEYQDSNLVQESLLCAVSKEDEGEYNRFMVGDVKQSIYRFRLARPELFMEKYETYTTEASKCQKIELHQNFRSRNEVLEFTNDIFYMIMQKDLGNVTYDDAAALYPGASYVENTGVEAELLLADSEEEALEEAGLTDAISLEAEIVASKIRQLMREQLVTDKKTGELRNMCYSDIVILLRSFGRYADTFLEIFEQKGIPAHATSKTGYFQALEVQTILSFLRILDNPRQDIPLAAVLRSPIGDFSDEELALLKAAGGDWAFHRCVLQPQDLELPEILKDKILNFLEMLNAFRTLTIELPVHELLYRIFEETGYLHYVSAMPGGVRRKANLEMLLEKAVAYEKTSYRGVFHFIRYIDRLQKYEVDYGEAEVVSENANAVRLMTIHKSKGLEFPVVFLCGTTKKFNHQDTRSSVVIHPELGVGVDFIDPVARVKGSTLYKKAIARQIELENSGEELRVLYVALTRAKEKLIITGVRKKQAEILEKMRLKSINPREALPFLERSKADCYLDWILPAVIAYGEKYSIKMWTVQDLVNEEAESQLRKANGLAALLHLVSKPVEWADKLVDEQLSWKYPYAAETDRKSKYSVSELKHRAMDAVVEEEEQWSDVSAKSKMDKSITEYIPKFAGGESEINQGALRGSAMHRAVECLPVEKLAGNPNIKAELDKEIQKLLLNGRLTEEMASLIRRDKLIRFYQSPLALRMKKASENKMLYIEKPFVMGKKAGQIEQNQSDTMVLIQGIIDAFFIEDGEIVLLDYKTDVVSNELRLADLYREQLNLYQQALEGNLGKKVKEKLLYSFYLDQTIKI